MRAKKKETRHRTKSIIILVIVFGIRFALFCYLPIHSITLSFVTTTFVVGGWVFSHTHRTTLTKSMKRHYTHILLLFNVHALRLSETEKAITKTTAEAATNYTYCILDSFNVSRSCTVSHDKRERWKLNDATQ